MTFVNTFVVRLSVKILKTVRNVANIDNYILGALVLGRRPGFGNCGGMGRGNIGSTREEKKNYSCLVYERKTKDCVRSWTFQHKFWYLRLFL